MKKLKRICGYISTLLMLAFVFCGEGIMDKFGIVGFLKAGAIIFGVAFILQAISCVRGVER